MDTLVRLDTEAADLTFEAMADEILAALPRPLVGRPAHDPPILHLPPCVVCGVEADGVDKRDEWLCTQHLDDPMCLEPPSHDGAPRTPPTTAQEG